MNDKTSDYVNGLYVKNGRLINDRSDGVSGIEQASMYRKQKQKQYKIDCIADGIEKAKEREDMNKNFYKF